MRTLAMTADANAFTEKARASGVKVHLRRLPEQCQGITLKEACLAGFHAFEINGCELASNCSFCGTGS